MPDGTEAEPPPIVTRHCQSPDSQEADPGLLGCL